MSEWVSVDDRLPEMLGNGKHSDTVLVYGKWGVELGQFWQDGTWSDEDTSYEIPSVKYWRALPEPPNE